ncbi:PLP-dependent aminotransferase family protein [Bradyrhizobium sp. AUGA SZCCT0176]|uniref:MocR-like pyridoxine biosynthesis transcription factor PdxR n=1 Tax=Bradyrhizobium sp. AUGA SZCCT0176 TaxID=2807664 RepID=UPI001BA845D6|nr:PLP-dependent aminotransferase family protein [Bradyrhizobium sp. AUGA SZCCT0176]MBR1225163.1 PLP-dependent aminotransferase family protein [Bradyrhizobium sp. AUGA SZCCT0176]
MQISLDIDPNTGVSLQAQLIEQIKASIMSGRFRPGERLPGTRALSEQIGISRNTVLLSYESLVAQGYVETREGAGTYVSQVSPEQHQFVGEAKVSGSAKRSVALRARVMTAHASARSEIVSPRFDFELESNDPDLFPRNVWRRLTTRHMQSSHFNLTDNGAPNGSRHLREVLSRYLAASRGIMASPDQIVIVTGIQQALNIVARLCVQDGTPVVMEAPGCSSTADLFKSYGGKIHPATVDHEGLIVEYLPQVEGGVAFVTPARQFPMGGALPNHRRIALVEWAAKFGAYVLEADFDSDFRYEGSPQPALQTLDKNERVIYAGSFATSIGPGLRIGYMVLPPNLVDAAIQSVSLLDYGFPCYGVPWLDQAVLTDFIGSGGFDNHLRCLRRAYLERRDCLADQLRRHFGRPDLRGMNSGTHIVWRIPDEFPHAAELQERALRNRVAIYTLKDRTIADADYLDDWDRYVLLGFASMKPAAIGPAVQLIAESCG